MDGGLGGITDGHKRDISSEASRIVVYKVVRLDECGRLISAILPTHLARVYRRSDGRMVTVPKSLAFEHMDDAMAWRRSVYPGQFKGKLEVWRAEVESTCRPGLRITCMELGGGRGTGLVYFDRGRVSVSRWRDALAKLAGMPDTTRFLEVAGLTLKVEAEREGVVECTNLRIIERVDA